MDKRIHGYPKVLHMGHRYLDGLLSGNWHIEEKLDGSQISFGVFGGELFVRSKGQMLELSFPEKMFSLGVATIEALKDRLVDGWIYRGEYLRSPKHNTLTYDRVPVGHIMIFDIETAPGNCLDYADKLRETEAIGLECIPMIEKPDTSGLPSEWVNGLLAQTSVLGGPKMEGIVVKNYERITDDGKFMVGKYVSEAFKERHTKEWKAANPSKKDVTQDIIDSLKTIARFYKAIQRLRDDGKLTESPQDIGALLKILHVDIEAEEKEYIKDKLYEHAIKGIKRGVCGGFPEWYKEKLLDGLDITNEPWKPYEEKPQ